MLSYLVAQRRREIGIRMALGASRETVLGGVMAHGLALTLIGIAAGLGAAIMSTRLMKTLLFEVSPNDPVTLSCVAGVITVVAAAACLIPALRATQVGIQSWRSGTSNARAPFLHSSPRRFASLECRGPHARVPSLLALRRSARSHHRGTNLPRVSH